MDIFRSASRQSTHVIRVPEFAGTAYGIKPSHDQSGYQLHSLSPLRPETAFHFSDPSFENPAYIPPESNNSAWARARRSPVIHATWKDAPTLSELWTFAYTVFTLQPKLEQFRLNLKLECTTAEIDKYLALIYDTGFAIPHPNPAAPPGQPVPTCERHKGELVVYRSSFWQGAGSSSCQPAWINPLLAQASFPPRPLQYTITTGFADARVHAQHPIRPPKPEPASMIYSRWIPHLDEMFSMIALDFTDAKHLQYFHEWQNSPRVAAGWNETGTLEEHREYLRRIHEDPHQFAVLGQFDGVPFAYFEIYWTKEDHVGAYYNAGDYDRGRHFLVGNEKYRGPHRVKAWHTSLTHYMFLDDPRTNVVVGEPRATGAKVLAYDQANGYHIEKFIDLPHKRAALVKCSREKFFQVVPFEYEEDEKDV